jgi:ferredoxin
VVEMPVIDVEKCDGCGLCIGVCHCNMLVLVDNVVNVAAKEGCISCKRWCSRCEDVCPHGAINWPFDIVIADR